MKKIIIIFLIFFPFFLCAQNEDIGKRTSIIFLSNENIAEDNFGKESLLNWLDSVQQAMGLVMKTDKTNSTVKVIASWIKGNSCNYEISTCPDNKSLINTIHERLQNVISPVAKFSPFGLMFVYRFNDGCSKQESFSPELLPWDERTAKDFSALSLAEQKENIRNWVKNNVSPVFAYYTSAVDDKFVGVRYTGKVLSKAGYLDKKTDDVTNNSSLYWRGVMEMSPGNFLVQASQVFMHVENDEFDIARRYLSLLLFFADKKSIAASYLKDLANKFDLFYHTHDSLVQKGIALHDKGKFDDAIHAYQDILAQFPGSAWASYELYFSTNAKSGLLKKADKTVSLWNDYKTGVYNADPLYPMGGGANNSKDAYILFRHMEVGELFKDNKKLKEDLIRYADIALDLEAYAFAAHIYWNLYTVSGTEKWRGRDFLTYFLYSLEKQGVSGVQSFFKTDYSPEFVKIDQERMNFMKDNTMYKPFKE